MLHILFVHMHVVRHFLFGEMRELRAVLRTNFIDRTFIGLKVKELAGCVHIHPFAFFVFVQPFFFELFYRHPEMLRDALQVFERVGWRHVAAAVGTGQAIRFLPHLPVNGLCKNVKVFRWIVFNFCKETPEARAVLQYIVSKSFPGV